MMAIKEISLSRLHVRGGSDEHLGFKANHAQRGTRRSLFAASGDCNVRRREFPL
jgi:hypothetical protein